MKLPSFLVIGAMKCGTTTLYHDLSQNPEIYLPEKESNFLSGPTATSTSATANYAALYKNVRQNQCCGEVSTEYSMLPDITGIPELAQKLLGNETKIIYLVREPVSRAISHHYHMYSHHGPGKMGSDINKCVEQHPSIINYGRYGMQIEPWRIVFGDPSIKVIVFEEYVRDRGSTLRQVFDFLGVSCSNDINPTEVHNRSDGKKVLNDFWKCVHQSSFYREYLRPHLPVAYKRRLSNILLPAAPTRPSPPSIETIEKILDRTRSDRDQIRDLSGRNKINWDTWTIQREHLGVALTQAG